MCIYKRTHTHIYTCMCIHMQMYQKFYFHLLAKNRFKVYHYMSVFNFKNLCLSLFQVAGLQGKKDLRLGGGYSPAQ